MKTVTDFRNILISLGILVVGMGVAGTVMFWSEANKVQAFTDPPGFMDAADMCPNHGVGPQGNGNSNDTPDPVVPRICPDGATPMPYTESCTEVCNYTGPDGGYNCGLVCTKYYTDCPVACTPSTQTTINACDPGETGTGRTYERTSSCPSGSWGSWTLINDQCTPTCTRVIETNVNNCPAGYSGTRTMQRNSSNCTPGVWTEWFETGNNCTPIDPVCDPVSAAHTYPCNPGETGTGRTYQALGNTCQPGVWSDWSLIANNCTTSCPSFATTTIQACNPGETGTGRTYQSTTRAVDLACTLAWNPWTLVSSDCAPVGVCTSSTTRQTYSCNPGETGTGRIYKTTASVCETSPGVWGPWSPWSPWVIETNNCVPTIGPAGLAPSVNLKVRVYSPVVTAWRDDSGDDTSLTNPLQITAGQEIELDWRSQNSPDSCDGVDFSTGAQINGSTQGVAEPTAIAPDKIYKVICKKAGFSDTEDWVYVRYTSGTPINPPTIRVTPSVINKGGSVVVSGEQNGHTGCSISGARINGALDTWTVPAGTTYTQSTGSVLGRTTFTLTCSSWAGNEAKATVEVKPQTTEE